MTDQTFGKRQDCVNWLQTRLALDPVSAVGEGLLDGFAVTCKDTCKDTGKDGGVFETQLNRWVIRDEDLNLFATVRDIIAPMAATEYVLSNEPAAVVTGVVLAVIDLLRKAKRYGAWLNPPHAEIVAVLKKRREPLTPGEILRELPSAKPPWTEQMVQDLLEELSEIVTNNGVVALVRKTRDGKWCLSGV